MRVCTVAQCGRRTKGYSMARWNNCVRPPSSQQSLSYSNVSTCLTLTSLDQSNFANHSNLATGCWKSVVVEVLLPCRRKCCRRHPFTFDNRKAWWWPQCLLHLLLFAQVVRAFPMFTFYFSIDVFSFGPLAKRSHYSTFFIGDTFRLKMYSIPSSSRNRSRMLVLSFFLALLRWSRAL